MIPKLSSEQRRALAEIGTPIPIYDPDAQSGFILIPAEISSDPLGGYLAAIPNLQVTRRKTPLSHSVLFSQRCSPVVRATYDRPSPVTAVPTPTSRVRT